ncbi:recombinase family protein [Bosea sp. TAF32]|uniref:recombinase family protein n=1 Tax=Bosea sp. TAF32 TaxID=3237482 RepID=UPI003F909930
MNAISNLCHLYQRVSSGTQLEGSGLDRQLDNTHAYIARNGLEVVRTYSDRGVSAYRGKNRRVGELALILRHIDQGVIRPGEHLIIESVDRLSRQAPLDALDTFKAILARGVIVHSVYENSKFTLDDLNKDIGRLMSLMVSMGRANEESRYKSSRVADAHAKGRVNGTIVAGSVPSWLEVVKDKVTGTKSFKVKPREKQIVKEMFDLCAAGMSSYRIAQEMRARDYEPFGVARRRVGSVSKGAHHWNATSVQDILRGRAVLGEFRSYTTSYDAEGKRILTLASVNPHYYEPIIEPDLWEQANAALKLRKKARSRGRTGEEFANILKDVVACEHCGLAMHIKVQYETKGGARYTRLRCAGRSENVCDNTKMPRYLAVERAVLEFVTEIDLKDRRSEEVAALHKVIAADQHRISVLNTEIRTIITAFKGSSTAVEMVQEMEAEKALLNESLAANRNKRDAIASRQSPGDRKAALKALWDKMETTKGAELYAVRVALNLKIKETVEKIMFNRDGQIAVHMIDDSVFYAFDGKGTGMRIGGGKPDPNIEATFEGVA